MSPQSWRSCAAGSERDRGRRGACFGGGWWAPEGRDRCGRLLGGQMAIGGGVVGGREAHLRVVAMAPTVGLPAQAFDMGIPQVSTFALVRNRDHRSVPLSRV